MIKYVVLCAALALTGCAAASIPDNIPPAPPKRTGEPITAPSNAPAEEPAMDGFGGDGFGGVTPTIEVEAPTESEAEPEAEDEEKEAADDAKKPADGDGKPASDAGAAEATPNP